MINPYIMEIKWILWLRLYRAVNVPALCCQSSQIEHRVLVYVCLKGTPVRRFRSVIPRRGTIVLRCILHKMILPSKARVLNNCPHIERLTLLFRNREILDWNPSPEDDYSEWDLSWCSSILHFCFVTKGFGFLSQPKDRLRFSWFSSVLQINAGIVT
jgi:hypothetical protein